MAALESVTATPVEPTPPASLLSCGPWLWQQRLFPRACVSSAKSTWLAWLLLLVLPAAALYPCTSFYLLEPDEGRYAEIPREMLIRGEWLIPYLQGEPYLDKPPLVYWLVMVSYTIFGVHDWAARLVPALAVHGTILLLYGLGRRQVGECAAFWGALMLFTAPGFLGMGRLLLLDGVLCFLSTLTLLTILEAVRGERLRWSWWLLAATACGLGMLTKGPIVLILTLVPLLLHGWLSGRTHWLHGRTLGLFLGLAALIALPWYAALCVRLPEFAHYFLWEHNVMRFLQPFDHVEPVWFYVPVLCGGLLPQLVLLLLLVRSLLLGSAAQAPWRTREAGFLLLTAGWCLLFFSLSGSKLATYILPAFPPLCLVLGAFIAATRWRHSRLMHGSLAAMYAFILLAHYLLVPWYAEQRSPMNDPEQIRQLCADPAVPILCYPRNADSLAFYLGREDLRCFRSKATADLLQFLQTQRKTVILFGHRHSMPQLAKLLPNHLELRPQSWRHDIDLGAYMRRVMGDWSLQPPIKQTWCDLAVVEERGSGEQKQQAHGNHFRGLHARSQTERKTSEF